MTIKTLETIHNALMRRLDSQQYEHEILVNALEKQKKEGAPENEIEMSMKIIKESREKIADIEDALAEFENTSFVIGH